MKKTDTLCQRLGIKQQDMADYLGVSGHMMAQYETDKRNLPVEARLKLAHLELLLFQLSGQPAAAAPLPHAAEHAEKTKKHLHRHAANCQYKARLAENRLEAMQTKCAQAQQLLHLLQALEAELPAGHMDKLWVQIMRSSTMEKLVENGQPAQIKLQLRIGSLQQEEALTRGMLADL